MRMAARALGLVLVLLLGGCFVETENTLAEPDPKTMDEKLLGNWYSHEGSEVAMFSVAADSAQHGVYNVVFVSLRADGGKPVQYERYRVWRTVLNGQAYLNVVRLDGTMESPKTQIVAYEIGTDGRLVINLLDSKVVAAAIDAGKLKGTVKKGQYVDEVAITAPRTELAAFVAAANRNELFAAKTGPLTKLPETQK